MLEEEAGTRVCPVGQMRGSFDGNWDKGHCIGSRCMAWRWSAPAVPERAVHQTIETTVPRIKIQGPGPDWFVVDGGRDKPDRPGDQPLRWVVFAKIIPAAPGKGFCGLAGSPS